MFQARVASFDATEVTNAEITESEEISGYPTLAVYKNGVRIADYHGERTER